MDSNSKSDWMALVNENTVLREQSVRLIKQLEDCQAECRRMTEVRLKALEYREGGEIQMELACEVLPIISAGMVKAFKDMGGINYVEWKVGSPEIGPFTLTMQRLNGKTPGTMKAEADARAADLASQLAQLKEERCS